MKDWFTDTGETETETETETQEMCSPVGVVVVAWSSQARERQHPIHLALDVRKCKVPAASDIAANPRHMRDTASGRACQIVELRAVEDRPTRAVEGRTHLTELLRGVGPRWAAMAVIELQEIHAP